MKGLGNEVGLDNRSLIQFDLEKHALARPGGAGQTTGDFERPEVVFVPGIVVFVEGVELLHGGEDVLPSGFIERRDACRDDDGAAPESLAELVVEAAYDGRAGGVGLIVTHGVFLDWGWDGASAAITTRSRA